MSANLPSRGGRRQSQDGQRQGGRPQGSSGQRQGPGGREVQQAARPGSDRDAGRGSSQGPGGREVVRGEPAGAGRREGEDRRGSGSRPTQRPAAGGAVRQGELSAEGADTGPNDADRRRLRTQRALRSPRAVRQAILLREILGPPVALRRHREDPPSLSD